MADFEDFVVDAIIRDFQQPQPTPVAQPQSSFLEDARYGGQIRESGGLPPGAVADRSSPYGFTIADPAARARYVQHAGQLDASAAGGAVMDRAYRERDANRMKIMSNIRGLDPQVQAALLRRIGLDTGPVKSQLDQQKELARFRQELDAPQQQVANALRMLTATQAGQRNIAETQFKERKLESEEAAGGQVRNIRLMQVLATLMQANPQLAQTLGPVLMQMLQGSGINLSAPAAGGSATKRPGVTITRE